MKSRKARIAGIGLAAAAGLIWAIISINTPKAPLVISGRVTSISNECNLDGTCSVTLDDSRMIVTGCGLVPRGETCKTYDQSKLHVGQLVEATVTKVQQGVYGLGCDTCIVRVISN